MIRIPVIDNRLSILKYPKAAAVLAAGDFFFF